MSAAAATRGSRLRTLAGPAAMVVAMLAVLIGLGVWQVQRLAWKTALLADIERAEQAPALPLTTDPAPFQKVRLRGTFRSGPAATYRLAVRDMPAGAVLGSYQLVPLDREGAPPVLVIRGWVPQALAASAAVPPGPTVIDGYVRPAEHAGWFAVSDDRAGRHFYTLDPRAIGAALGLPAVAPFSVVALGPEVAGSYPIPAQSMPRPPNNHLSYALTWFGLAAVLVVIFAIWASKVLRT